MFTSRAIMFRIEQDISSIEFNPIAPFALTGMAPILLFVELWVVYRKRNHPQPAAFGHLKILVGLIDDWGSGAEDRGDYLWWTTPNAQQCVSASSHVTSIQVGDTWYKSRKLNR
jgi:hypothetical protein